MVRSTRLDPARYSRGAGGAFFVMRSAILDAWVRAFLAGHPAGTVVEIGTGLNTRFERVDNGQSGWIDLDLPDVIELRRRFFADSSPAPSSRWTPVPGGHSAAGTGCPRKEASRTGWHGPMDRFRALAVAHPLRPWRR